MEEKEEKSKYYFKIIPKEEFPKFIERFKQALDKKEFKKGDHKSFELEIRGTNEELVGPSIKLSTFDKTKFNEFLDLKQEYIKNSLYCISLNLNAKDEDSFVEINKFYETYKPFFENTPSLKKENVEIHFRKNGLNYSFEIVFKEGILLKALMDLGLDFTEYHKFNFDLKSGLDLEEFFNPSSDPNSIFLKICTILLSIKSDNENIKYLCGALNEALKDVKLNDKAMEEKLNKFCGYLNFINSFIGTKLKLEYDARVFTRKVSKHNKQFQEKIFSLQPKAVGIVKQILIPIIISLGLNNLIKASNIDCISLILSFPNYKNGYNLLIQIPGLTKILNCFIDEYHN